MPRCLGIIEGAADPLWVEAWTRHWRANQEVICLTADSAAPFPHRWNLPGWRRYLQDQAIDAVHLFAPRDRGALVALAARLAGVPVTAHLAETPTPTRQAWARLTVALAQRVCCPDAALRHRLARAVGAADRIEVTLPELPLAPLAAEESRRLRRQWLGRKATGPIILALAAPADRDNLVQTVWTAGLLYHADPNTRLMLHGHAGSAEKQRLEKLRRVWGLQDMIMWAPSTCDFGQVAQATDVVLTLKPHPARVVRCRAALAVGATVLAPADYPLAEAPAPGSLHRQAACRPRDFAAQIFRRYRETSP